MKKYFSLFVLCLFPIVGCSTSVSSSDNSNGASETTAGYNLSGKKFYAFSIKTYSDINRQTECFYSDNNYIEFESNIIKHTYGQLNTIGYIETMVVNNTYFSLRARNENDTNWRVVWELDGEHYNELYAHEALSEDLVVEKKGGKIIGPMYATLSYIERLGGTKVAD